MLKKIDLHLRVARDDLESVDDSLGVPTPSEVAEVRRPATDERHDVDGRHGQAGAVAEDSDLAVELHVRDTLLAGQRLERVGCGDVAHLGDRGLPEQRIVVDRELRVERPHFSLRRHDQRVDLAEHRVAPDEGLVELSHDRRDLLLLGSLGDATLVHETRACQGWQPSSGSTWRRTSASGLVAATSSMSTPPCVVNMKSGFFALRSNVSER